MKLQKNSFETNTTICIYVIAAMMVQNPPHNYYCLKLLLKTLGTVIAIYIKKIYMYLFLHYNRSSKIIKGGAYLVTIYM